MYDVLLGIIGICFVVIVTLIFIGIDLKKSLNNEKKINNLKDLRIENLKLTKTSSGRKIDFEALSLKRVKCCVKHSEGITKDNIYFIKGVTFNKEMYIINNDNDELQLYGVDLFKAVVNKKA
jgi:hypothetical protein